MIKRANTAQDLVQTNPAQEYQHTSVGAANALGPS